MTSASGRHIVLAAHQLMNVPVLLLALLVAVTAGIASATRHETSFGASATSARLASLGLLVTLHVGLDVLDEHGIAGTSKEPEWSRDVHHCKGSTWAWWIEKVAVRVRLKVKIPSVSNT
jgi:hypothetical protein